MSIIKTELLSGIVVSRYGNRADVEDESGQLIPCHIRRALSDLVTGDKVQWQYVPADDNEIQGVIVGVVERTSVLQRPIRYQGLKPVAANIDQVLVMTAVEPPFSHRILDRYLVAIEQSNIQAVLVLNKIDLLDAQHHIYQQMNIYTALGYPVIAISSAKHINMNSLIDCLANKTSVLVGQSGVGKSSLVNELLPNAKSSVSRLSDTSGLGTHTTTTSKLYHLKNGAALIDSPGIRDFGMDHLDPQQIANGFIEISKTSAFCKFRDCQHIKEPSCAVKAAVEDGSINRQRYHSYLHLYQESVEN